MNKITGYDYHTCTNKQDVISSIIESRLVPRDLTDISQLDYAKALLDNSFMFVDNNGKSTKISLQDLSNNIFRMVDDLPTSATIGQIVLQKLNDGQYKLMRLDVDNNWVELNLVTDASLVSYINTNAQLKASDVQSALDELDNHLEDDYWQKRFIQDVALTGDAVDIATEPIEGLESTNLQKVLEEILSKQLVGFTVKRNADKIQLYLDEGTSKAVLGADIVKGSIIQSDLDAALNEKIEIIIPSQERITALEGKTTSLDELKADKSDVESKYATLTDRIATEEARSLAEDNKLENDLSTETARAISKENEIETNLNSEISRATSAEYTLQTNIDNEASTRESNDNTINDRLTEEISRAEAKEEEIQNNVDKEMARASGAESKEESERKTADADLQNQIDTITSRSDVVDVVGTKTELDAYTKSITDNDIVKVLKDETQDNATAYYRCEDASKTPYIWTLVGAIGPYYTEAESDNLFVPKTTTINGIALSGDIRLKHTDIDENPTIGDAKISIKKNGVLVNSFNLNDITDTDVDIYVATKLSEFTDDLGSAPTHTHNQYDTITDVNDKIKTVNTSIDAKANKTDVYTIAQIDELLLTEKTARETTDNELESSKQNKLTAGSNITIKNDVITAKDTYYYPGNGITFDDYSGHTDAKSISVDTSLFKIAFANISGEPQDNEALKTELDKKASVTELNTQVKDLNNQIATETTRAKGVEDTLSTDLITEISNRESADTSMKELIDTKVDKVAGSDLMTSEERNKLASIAEGAEVNVQADWAETDSTVDSFIKNKPDHLGNVDDVQVNGITVLSDRIANIDLTSYDTIKDREDADATIATNLTSHIDDTANPHKVTKDQVGLSNVDNTSDLNKPISTATQTALDKKLDSSSYVIDAALSNTSTNPVQNKIISSALDTKVDKVEGKSLSTNDFTNVLMAKLDGISEGACSLNVNIDEELIVVA